MSHIEQLLEDNDRLKRDRSNWNNQFQVLGEFISQIKQDFNTQHAPGEFLNEEVFDSTGTFAATNSASALMGILWPSSAKKSIKLDPPDDMENVTGEEREWYDEVATPSLARHMDASKANLILSLDEYMLDQVIFGTSGIGVFWEDDGLLYRPFGVREMFIDEGNNSRINKVHLNFEWTPRKVVDTYGIENVSEKVKEQFEDSRDDKIKILIVYRPSEESSPMLFDSIHVEVETKHVVKKGGFQEFPVSVGRFRKLTTEKYGRSPGMNALPDILEANILREAIIVATEKILDPPLGLLNDGMLGGGVIDTSSGALNVFDVQNNVGGAPPVFPINTVGDIGVAKDRIADLQQSIAQHFFIDRLLDFNNQTQMTATETAARASIRNSSLASLISRQITELFTPLIERSFNLLVRHDKVGFIEGTAEARVAEALGEEVKFIPERIAERMLEGREAYTIRYTTPADRITNAEELDGMFQLIQLNQQLMQTHPEASAYLDVSEVQKQGVRLLGAPPEIIHTDEEVKEIQAAQAEQAQGQQQLDQAEQLAGIVGQVQ